MEFTKQHKKSAKERNVKCYFISKKMFENALTKLLQIIIWITKNNKQVLEFLKKVSTSLFV